MRERIGKERLTFSTKNNCKYLIDTEGSITLTLPCGTTRNIGTLHYTRENILVYYCYRNKEKHLMRVNQSYGVNETITSMFKPDIIMVIVDDTNEVFQINAKNFERDSMYMQFKKQGFELQKFIPINKMKMVEHER